MQEDASESSSSAGQGRPWSEPRIAIGASTSLDTVQAGHEAIDQLLGRTGAQPMQLLLVFFSPQHVDRAEELAALLQQRLQPATLLGVSSFAPICGERELERGPSVSLMGFCVPGLRCKAVALDDLPELPRTTHFEKAGQSTESQQQSDDALSEADVAVKQPEEHGTLIEQRPVGQSNHAWLAPLGLADHDAFGIITFVDPFSVAMTELLPDVEAVLAVRREVMGTRDGQSQGSEPMLVGGLASSSMKAGGNALMLGKRVLRAGGVLCTLAGPMHIDSVVSQGCRPIGAPMILTRAKNNLVYELGGTPVLDVIERALQPLGDQREAYLRRGLFLGLAADEFKPRFGRGDFLIRNVVGGDREHGYIAVADVPRVGQTVRLHVRDPKAATEDLALLLDAQKLYDAPLGALLITCNSRGERFFGSSGHDARAVARLFEGHEHTPDAPSDPLPSPLWTPPPDVAAGQTARDPLEDSPLYDPRVTPPAVAGFFAAGEIGPIGGRSHLHGHTACVVLFRARVR